MALGRSSEPKTVTVTKTTGQPTVTAPAGSFSAKDVGRPISGTGIQAATTILSVQSDTAATLSLNASGSGANAATIGSASSGRADALSYGFQGWSPETDAESNSYSVAAVNAGTVTPDRIANAYTPISQRSRG